MIRHLRQSQNSLDTSFDQPQQRPIASVTLLMPAKHFTLSTTAVIDNRSQCLAERSSSFGKVRHFILKATEPLYLVTSLFLIRPTTI